MAHPKETKIDVIFLAKTIVEIKATPFDRAKNKAEALWAPQLKQPNQ